MNFGNALDEIEEKDSGPDLIEENVDGEESRETVISSQSRVHGAHFIR